MMRKMFVLLFACVVVLPLVAAPTPAYLRWQINRAVDNLAADQNALRRDGSISDAHWQVLRFEYDRIVRAVANANADGDYAARLFVLDSYRNQVGQFELASGVLSHEEAARLNRDLDVIEGIVQGMPARLLRRSART